VTPEIDVTASALEPVRKRITAQIADLTDKVVSPRTPLELVPGYRGEIVALRWLLGELSQKKDVRVYD
jgi:hypothetical protein